MKQGEFFTLGIAHRSEISHEIETHQFEFEAVYLLACLRHLALWEQRCFSSACRSAQIGLLGFGGLLGCHIHQQHCQIFLTRAESPPD